MADQGRAVADKGREVAEKGRESARSMMERLRERAPSTQQVLRLVALLTGGADVLAIGGALLAGCAVTMTLATPLFLLFSPLLLPVGIVVALCTGGFVTTAVGFLAVCTTATWVFEYVRGRVPAGTHHVDAVKGRISEVTSNVADRAREAAGSVQSKAREAAPGA